MFMSKLAMNRLKTPIAWVMSGLGTNHNIHQTTNCTSIRNTIHILHLCGCCRTLATLKLSSHRNNNTHWSAIYHVQKCYNNRVHILTLAQPKFLFILSLLISIPKIYFATLKSFMSNYAKSLDFIYISSSKPPCRNVVFTSIYTISKSKSVATGNKNLIDINLATGEKSHQSLSPQTRNILSQPISPCTFQHFHLN
jgi:hypothetical protein